ncbi:MAG: hypothetical protein JNM17_14345 [Archangium sp.]|nr:hypothetical protein [Archangium sp.]
MRLNFFNEQDAPQLRQLLDAPKLFEHLRALKAGVTMGLRCLSDERAHAVRQFTDEGVTVGAWLLVEKQHGYFATPENHEHVTTRIESLLRWRDAHRLDVTSLGFDFEPDLRELEVYFHSPFRALRTWARRSMNRDRRARALDQYTQLIARVRAEGLTVESYQFPLVLEDRAAESAFFQRFTGSLDVNVEREVLMVYSSLLGRFGAGLTEQWTRSARAVAVGSTGGGIDPLPKLSFDELARDLRLAARACDDIRIFSLEGCVQHRYLERLVDFDWQVPVTLSSAQRVGAASIRRSARLLARLLA